MSNNDTVRTGDYLMDTQLLIEERMRNEGVKKMAEQISKQKNKRGEAGTQYGHQMLTHGLAKFAAGINEYMDSSSTRGGRGQSVKKLLKGGDVNVIGFVFMKFIINGISLKYGTLQSIVKKAAEQVEDEFRLADLRKQDAKLWKRLVDASNKKEGHWKRTVIVNAMNDEAGKGTINNWEPWTAGQLMQLGSKLLTILMDTVGLVQITTESKGRHNTVKRLVATPETLDWIDDRCSRIGLTAPQYKPLVIQPRDWTYENLSNGIYYTHFCRPVRFVKTNNNNYLEELKNCDIDVVLHSVNAMQRTPWAVNKDVLNLINELWDNGVEWCPSVPARYNETELNQDDFELETKQQWAAFYKEKNRIDASNRESAAKRIAFNCTITTAEEFAQHEEFYFGYNLDFRGRVYAVTAYNGMGPDEMKATLRFAKGKPLGENGWKWLAIHLANLGDFGKVSKDTLEARVQWVMDNEHWILQCVENPFENRQWVDADKPLQFMAAAIEWKGFIEQGDAFVSHLPIALDGSCSGLQHLSMATLCSSTAINVNILPTEKPADIYQIVADKVVARLREDAERPASHWGEPILNNMGVRVPNYTELALEWLKYGFGRKEAKRSVMTYSYGSKQYGFKEQIQTDVMHPLSRECNKTGMDFPFSYDNGYRASSYIARHLWDAVVDSVKRPAQLMDWLTDSASKVAKEKFEMPDGALHAMPVRWTTPLGFPVVQSYYDTNPRRVKTSINGALVYLTLKEATDQICTRKSAQSMAPNTVHSWDAAHLQLTVSRSADAGIGSFSLIHDSFGTHAGDTDEFWHIIRDAMVEMYSAGDITHALYLEMRSQMKPENREEIQLPPPKGTLDLAITAQSRYSFA